MGTKFTTKFWYVRSGDAAKKPILQFKEDQGDRKNVTGSGTIDRFLFTFLNWKSI